MVADDRVRNQLLEAAIALGRRVAKIFAVVRQ